MESPIPDPPEQILQKPVLPHLRPHSPIYPQAALGLSIGCFAGAGYGLSVGIGALRPVGQKAAVVTPSTSAKPFAHDGPLVGAFCGVFAGAGFASAIAMHLGYHGSLLAALFPPHDDTLAHGTLIPFQNQFYSLFRDFPSRVLSFVREEFDSSRGVVDRISCGTGRRTRESRIQVKNLAPVKVCLLSKGIVHHNRASCPVRPFFKRMYMEV